MRKIAADIIYHYQTKQSYLNIELNAALEKTPLSREDKDLITRIVYGTVQNEIYLMYQLEPFVHGKIKAYERAVLLISFYQLIFLTKIPTYAVCNEAVDMIKKKYGMQRSKLMNAILRNFIRQGVRPIEAKDELDYLSIETSTPLWLVKLLNKQLGKEKAIQICHSYLEKPSLAGRVNTLKASREDILAKFPAFKAGELSEDAILFEKGNIAHHELFKSGKVTIQDESSQLVGRFLNPKENSYVLDMCSAPGSKTTHLSALMNNTGKIEAYDIHEHKIQLIEMNAERLGAVNITAHAMDSTQLREVYPDETFDYLLLDAPCSGLGVIARKPEIKYQAPDSMDGIITLQRQLLEVAYYLLKPGGTMVYSTCTINKKENQMQMENFMKQYPAMQCVKEKLILPYEYHSDGFYMCKLTKGADNESNL